MPEPMPTVATLQAITDCDQYDSAKVPLGYDEQGCWRPDEYFEAKPAEPLG